MVLCMVLFEQAVVSKEASKQDRVIVTAVDASSGTVFGGESMSVTAAFIVGSSTVNLPRMSKQDFSANCRVRHSVATYKWSAFTVL